MRRFQLTLSITNNHINKLSNINYNYREGFCCFYGNRLTPVCRIPGRIIAAHKTLAGGERNMKPFKNFEWFANQKGGQVQ
jgi:hypothetical protein